MSRRRALLVALLGVGVVLASLLTDRIYAGWPYGIDLEIPLRAAARWAVGGEPYLAASFSIEIGPELPFLYPPFVLPLVEPLLGVPRELLFGAWFVLTGGALLYGLHRLRIPAWLWLPIAIWPAAFEGILVGNVQLVLFAAFAVVVTSRGATDPQPGDDRRLDADGIRLGFLAALVGALKVSQLHTWLWFSRRRPVAAVAGAAIIGAIALATLSSTGLEPYATWLRQVSMASDPDWPAIGFPLSEFLGRELGLAVTIATLVAAFALSPRLSPAWLGILTVLGSPSLHTYGLLFLLPAMLAVRLEIALLVALLLATWLPGIWLGIGLLAAALAASSRWPVLASDRARARARLPAEAAPVEAEAPAADLQTATDSAKRTWRAPSS